MTEPGVPATDAPQPALSREFKARRWWERLQPLLDRKPNPSADRGSLARLRRAGTPLDIIDEQAVFTLHKALGYGSGDAEKTLLPVAVAASVLARVREHDANRKPARAAGRERFGDRDLETAALSPGRMRRLLAARDPDDVHRQMRRLVDLCGSPLDVGALAILILDWFDEECGPKARTRFAYDYYAAGGTAPGSVPEPTPSTPDPSAA